MDINLEKFYFDRIHGYYTDLRIDSRWQLKSMIDNEPYGSLRIVSHPDLKPGYLRAIFNYVTSKKTKSDNEIIKDIEDYCIEIADLETTDIEHDVQTEQVIIERSQRELSELFGVNIF
ncbi:MAG: hypothetical protein ACOCVF_01980 [bacterium]